MSSSPLRHLRIMTLVMIVSLFLQYELGIATIIANPASIPPFKFSIMTFRSALEQVGGVALLHAGLGVWLVIISVINLILALRTKIRKVQIFSILSYLSIVIAAGGGLFFVLSGFQNDNASHAMATNFILSFTFSFIELYYARPVSN
ncbi:MAG TPA: hypothetical protein VII93_05805 [Anaerolineales bacterium]